MANFINSMKEATNFKYTENGSLAHKSTLVKLYDMFAFCGAYRTRSDEDCITLFKSAYEEDALHALKCLFYCRDIRGGQGERRFFRVCVRWLANAHPADVKANLANIAEYGRWDDFYALAGTKVEKDAFAFLKKQLALDIQSKTPSLLAKWLKSENTSSAESRALAKMTRQYFNLTPRQYRKILSGLRAKINVLETLMSANRWDEIEFDKIPSKAGFIYKNAFARRDIIKAKYEAFAKDENTKVNASTLYPYEVVHKATDKDGFWGYNFTKLSDVDRAMINKYWDNLSDYFNNATFNGIAVVDTSGSMAGYEASAPINVAISLGMYCAMKAKGPFANHFISFSRNPRLIEIEGVDFVDKVRRIYKQDLCENTNLEATFDLILSVAKRYNMSQEDLPQNIIIISDMEIDSARGWEYRGSVDTVMETARRKFYAAGYTMPHLIYWNVQARQNTILDNGENVSYVSGMSPSIFEQIMSGKTGVDLMLDKLDSKRYEAVKLG